MLGRIVSTILWVFLIFSPAGAADWPSVVSESGSSVGRITVKDGKNTVLSQGTGFVIQLPDGSPRMVTNAHVVSNADHNAEYSVVAEFAYTAEGCPEQICNLEIDWVNREQDLCLLKIGENFGYSLLLETGSRPVLMEEVLVMGYPLGKNFKATPGYLQAYQNIDGMGDVLDLSATVAPGGSGGPVLNGSGRVVGIMTAIIPGYNFNLALPVSNLIAMIQGQNSQKNVRIDSEPAGAWVFIDGKYKGKTPLELSLLDRHYTLTLEKKGYDNYKGTIGPWDESEKNYSIALENKKSSDPVVVINVTPANAKISINNKDYGPSPVSAQFPEGSILRINVEAAGYKNSLEFYEVSQDSSQSFDIEMKKGLF